MLTLSDFEILKSCFLFEDMGDFEFSKLNDFLKVENCSVAQYKKGEFIFDDDCLYSFGIILSGKATAVCSQGDKSALKVFSKGDVFGAAGVFCKDAKAIMSRVKATTTCRIIFLNRSSIEKLLKSNPNRAIKYIEFLSNRVEFLNKRIATFTSNQAVSRLAKYILENADSLENQDIGFASLARSLDISRASFYRAKNELEQSGAALLDSKKITILNIDVLKSHL